MIFNERSKQQLEAMRINPKEFSDSLFAQYGKNALHFDSLINQFSESSVLDLTTECFNEFIQDFGFSDDSSIFNQLYDLYNYLRLYRDGGVFKLFKGRQAEWGGPKIIITKSDVPPWDSGKLKEPITVYRGMSKSEYDSGSFGQSWTIQENVAQRFATDTYSDKESGIVVKCILHLDSVLHFDDQDGEGEVIVKYGSVSKTDIILN